MEEVAEVVAVATAEETIEAEEEEVAAVEMAIGRATHVVSASLNNHCLELPSIRLFSKKNFGSAFEDFCKHVGKTNDFALQVTRTSAGETAAIGATLPNRGVVVAVTAAEEEAVEGIVGTAVEAADTDIALIKLIIEAFFHDP